MRYRLVNVYGVRPEPFTAELITPAEDGFKAIVGVLEDSDDGNLAPGLSVWPVDSKDYEETDQFIERTPGEDRKHTPQLV